MVENGLLVCCLSSLQGRNVLVSIDLLILLALGTDRPGENSQKVDWEVLGSSGIARVK